MLKTTVFIFKFLNSIKQVRRHLAHLSNHVLQHFEPVLLRDGFHDIKVIRGAYFVLDALEQAAAGAPGREPANLDRAVAYAPQILRLR